MTFLATVALPVVFLKQFDHIGGRIFDKGNGDEVGKDFFGAPSGKFHEDRHVEKRVEEDKETVPQTDASVKGQKINLVLCKKS